MLIHSAFRDLYELVNSGRCVAVAAGVQPLDLVMAALGGSRLEPEQVLCFW